MSDEPEGTGGVGSATGQMRSIAKKEIAKNREREQSTPGVVMPRPNGGIQINAKTIALVVGLLTVSGAAWGAVSSYVRMEVEVKNQAAKILKLEEKAANAATSADMAKIERALSGVQTALGRVQLDVNGLCVAYHEGDASKCRTSR